MPRDSAEWDAIKIFPSGGIKVSQKWPLRSRFGRKKKKGYATTNWPYVVRLTVTLSLYLSPAQLRSPRPSFNPRSSAIHSSTKAFDGGRFFSPDFEEIYEPPRSDGLADSLGGRRSTAREKNHPICLS